jgi:predicted metal-dependent phosphoesterase TrpH
VDSIDDAFDYIGEGCDFYVEKETVILGKAIKAIRAAGGISVIAHLGEYDFSSDEMTMFFNYCRNNSVHGFECFHPSHTKIDLDNIVDNTLYMIDNSSTKYNFLLTAGSDFHGKNKKNILGETCICKLDERLIRVMNLSYLKTFKILEERLCI